MRASKHVGEATLSVPAVSVPGIGNQWSEVSSPEGSGPESGLDLGLEMNDMGVVSWHDEVRGLSDERPGGTRERDCQDLERLVVRQGEDGRQMVADPQTRATPTGAEGLGEREIAILAFERQWWKYPGAKEQSIREMFDLSATRYYQTLNALIDSPAAMAHDPLLIKRLARMRASRHKARMAKRLELG